MTLAANVVSLQSDSTTPPPGGRSAGWPIQKKGGLCRGRLGRRIQGILEPIPVVEITEFYS